jgi:small-conductance mechanosensitive channel
VLEEDVYPRAGLARGLSYALSSLLNYVLLTLGFLAGLAVLGLDLTKVTILASAFGVGIGFGLQSVVNNCVSGLILLFERPIHVGDAVQVGSLQGRVRRIGIRASVVHCKTVRLHVRSPDEKAARRRRRLIKRRGVTLQRIRRGHPDAGLWRTPPVLRQPAPRAFFTGFGDSAINFEYLEPGRTSSTSGSRSRHWPRPCRCGPGGPDLVSLPPARGA